MLTTVKNLISLIISASAAVWLVWAFELLNFSDAKNVYFRQDISKIDDYFFVDDYFRIYYKYKFEAHPDRGIVTRTVESPRRKDRSIPISEEADYNARIAFCVRNPSSELCPVLQTKPPPTEIPEPLKTLIELDGLVPAPLDAIEVLEDCEVLTAETWSCRNGISFFTFEGAKEFDIGFIDDELYFPALERGTELYIGGIGKTRWYRHRRTCGDYCFNNRFLNEDEDKFLSKEERMELRELSQERLREIMEQHIN